MIKFTPLYAATALLLLAGCAEKFATDVSRFHRLPQSTGETFVIAPLDKSKEGSLEFASYAGLVAHRMVELGYHPVSNSDAPALIVKLDYGVGEGREKIESYGGYADYFYDPYFHGFHHGFYGGGGFGYGHGFGGFGYGGYGNDVYSYTVYTRKVTLNIERAQSGERLFEGRVVNVGRDDHLPEVMPYLVQAMFTNFPGDSGKTKRVVIDLAKTASKN